MADEHDTRPVNGTKRISGPLNGNASDSGLRAIDRTPDVCIIHSEPRPYCNIPTRILYPPREAFQHAKSALEDKNGRRHFEMYLDLVDTLGPYDRLHLVARFRKGSYEGYIQTRRGIMVVVGDRALADAWEKLRKHFPQTIEATALWCFNEFPSWDNESWIKYWQEKQRQARERRES